MSGSPAVPSSAAEISARAFKRVFTCKCWLRYSRERALRKPYLIPPYRPLPHLSNLPCNGTITGQSLALGYINETICSVFLWRTCPKSHAVGLLPYQHYHSTTFWRSVSSVSSQSHDPHSCAERLSLSSDGASPFSSFWGFPNLGFTARKSIWELGSDFGRYMKISNRTKAD